MYTLEKRILQFYHIYYYNYLVVMQI